MPHVTCQCGSRLEVKDRLAGTTVKCPVCAQPLAVPPLTADPSPEGGEGSLSSGADPPRGATSPPLGPPDPPPVSPPPLETGGFSEKPGVSRSKLGSILTAVPRFYWSRGAAFRARLGELIPALARDDHACEIRVQQHEYRRADGWEVDLPPVCVTCGKRVSSKPVRQRRRVEDVTWVFWTPPLALLVGVFGALVWSIWCLPIAAVLGVLAGPLFCRRNDVELTLYRCREHRQDRRHPRLRMVGEWLIVVAGDRAVRRMFHQAGLTAAETAHGDDVPLPVRSTARVTRASDDPIPLADEAHGDIVIQEPTMGRADQASSPS